MLTDLAGSVEELRAKELVLTDTRRAWLNLEVQESNTDMSPRLLSFWWAGQALVGVADHNWEAALDCISKSEECISLSCVSCSYKCRCLVAYALLVLLCLVRCGCLCGSMRVLVPVVSSPSVSSRLSVGGVVCD